MYSEPFSPKKHLIYLIFWDLVGLLLIVISELFAAGILWILLRLGSNMNYSGSADGLSYFTLFIFLTWGGLFIFSLKVAFSINSEGDFPFKQKSSKLPPINYVHRNLNSLIRKVPLLTFLLLSPFLPPDSEFWIYFSQIMGDNIPPAGSVFETLIDLFAYSFVVFIVLYGVFSLFYRIIWDSSFIFDDLKTIFDRDREDLPNLLLDSLYEQCNVFITSLSKSNLDYPGINLSMQKIRIRALIRRLKYPQSSRTLDVLVVIMLGTILPEMVEKKHQLLETEDILDWFFIKQETLHSLRSWLQQNDPEQSYAVIQKLFLEWSCPLPLMPSFLHFVHSTIPHLTPFQREKVAKSLVNLFIELKTEKKIDPVKGTSVVLRISTVDSISTEESITLTKRRILENLKELGADYILRIISSWLLQTDDEVVRTGVQMLEKLPKNISLPHLLEALGASEIHKKEALNLLYSWRDTQLIGALSSDPLKRLNQLEKLSFFGLWTGLRPFSKMAIVEESKALPSRLDYISESISNNNYSVVEERIPKNQEDWNEGWFLRTYSDRELLIYGQTQARVEPDHLEVKSEASLYKTKKKVQEVINAFANGNSGMLYIGIDSKGNVTGLSNVSKVKEDIGQWSHLNSPVIHIKTRVLVHQNTTKDAKKEVLLVLVPRTRYLHEFNGQVFERIASVTKAVDMTRREEIVRLKQDPKTKDFRHLYFVVLAFNISLQLTS